MRLPEIIGAIVISIHAPREGGDSAPEFPALPAGISIHAPREGGDHLVQLAKNHRDRYFKPRPPRGGATALIVCFAVCATDFNPRPPRGGRPFRLSSAKTSSGISIHAPREGGDYTI